MATNRTALFSRKQSGGVFTVDDITEHPGDIWFVDSGHASASNAAGFGKNPDAPFATLDYAVGNCTASNGDVIYIMPGHAENLTAADTVDVDVAGVTIIGLGRGPLKPTFSTTAAAGSITIDAANVAIKNIKLLANFATGTTTGLTVTASADGLTLDALDFRDTSTANEFLIHISVATTVTDLWIKNCSFIALTGGSMTNSILFAGTTSDLVIEDCVFLVDSADDVIDHLTAKATDARVSRNIVINADTGAAGYCYRTHATSTGIANDNRFGYNKVDAEISTGAATWWFQNYASNTIAESGLLDPATTHAIP